MARRASRENADSLELLLDTICNVFGGIILMAILVVLQTQGSLERIPEQVESPEGSLEVERLTFEITRLDRQLAEQKQRKRELDERFQRTASPDTAILLNRREEVVKAIQEAEKRIEKLTQEERVAKEMESRLAAQQTELTETIDSRRRQVEGAARRREQAVASNTTIARLPQWHESRTSGQRIYLVSGKKAYKLSGSMPLEGKYVSGDCTVTPMAERNAIFVEPREGSGTPLPSDHKLAVIYRNVLKTDSPEEHLISFFVHTDNESFATFQVVRTIVVAEGYEYSVGLYDGSGVPLIAGKPPAE